MTYQSLDAFIDNEWEIDKQYFNNLNYPRENTAREILAIMKLGDAMFKQPSLLNQVTNEEGEAFVTESAS
jgi:hypothetical protein